MQLFHRPTKVLITGASGCGKSTYWTKLILGYPARTKFVFDHEGELQERIGIRAAASPRAAANAIAGGWCIFDPVRFSGDFEAAFNFFCEFAYEAAGRLPGTKLFACDEIQEFVGTRSIEVYLKRILQRGRRQGLDLVVVSQQPNELHNAMRAQFTEVVSFVQCEQCAIEWLARYGFAEADLRSLGPGQFIARHRGSFGQRRGRVF